MPVIFEHDIRRNLTSTVSCKGPRSNGLEKRLTKGGKKEVRKRAIRISAGLPNHPKWERELDTKKEVMDDVPKL